MDGANLVDFALWLVIWALVGAKLLLDHRRASRATFETPLAARCLPCRRRFSRWISSPPIIAAVGPAAPLQADGPAHLRRDLSVAGPRPRHRTHRLPDGGLLLGRRLRSAVGHHLHRPDGRRTPRERRSTRPSTPSPSTARIFNFGLYLLSGRAVQAPPAPGRVFATYLVLYGVGRFRPRVDARRRGPRFRPRWRSVHQPADLPRDDRGRRRPPPLGPPAQDFVTTRHELTVPAATRRFASRQLSRRAASRSGRDRAPASSSTAVTSRSTTNRPRPSSKVHEGDRDRRSSNRRRVPRYRARGHPTRHRLRGRRSCWSSTSPPGWSSTPPPATPAGPWSTPCSTTAPIFRGSAASSGPASSTVSTRTPPGCWWWRRPTAPTSRCPSPSASARSPRPTWPSVTASRPMARA